MPWQDLFRNGTRATAAGTFALLLAACQAATPERVDTFSAIGRGDTVYLTGTEPFWSGEIARGEAVWKTPEAIAGTRFAVERFAGNNGVSFTGRLESQQFDVMVTPGRCSDGMSDRTYPYTASVRIGDRQLSGCAWTDRQMFNGPVAP